MKNRIIIINLFIVTIVIHSLQELSETGVEKPPTSFPTPALIHSNEYSREASDHTHQENHSAEKIPVSETGISGVSGFSSAPSGINGIAGTL